MSIIPKFEPGEKRVTEINFEGTVAPGDTLCLCSSVLPYPVRVLLAKMIFGPDANNWIRMSWYISASFQDVATSFPSGENIFGEGGGGGSFRGTAIERVSHSNRVFNDPENYAVLLVVSTSPYVYEVNASLIVAEV